MQNQIEFMQNKNHKLFSILIQYNYHKFIESPYSNERQNCYVRDIYIMEFECGHAVDSLVYFGLKGWFEECVCVETL